MNLVDKLTALSLTHKQLGIDELSEVAKTIHRTCMGTKYPLFVLHTCNRVEVYLYDAPGDFVELVKSGYAPYVDRVVEYRGFDAARHLFRVAAGLESMLIGETDILGQLEEAFDKQVKAGYTCGLLKTVVERAIRVGKRVRTETGISRGPRGLGSLAIIYVRRRLRLEESDVCVIGAGSVGRGIVKELRDAGARRVTVLNRIVEKAAHLGVEARPLTAENVERCLKECDVVFTAVSVFEPVITSVPRDARTKLIVDLGMPRNMAPGLPVDVVTIEELQGIAEECNKLRIDAIRVAERIVEEEMGMLEIYLRRRWAEELVAPLLALWVGVAREEGRRSGGGLAEVAALSTAKRTLLPLVNYIKELAARSPEDAYRLMALLDGVYRGNYLNGSP
jgi:glutamyl-tRNA reductase